MQTKKEWCAKSGIRFNWTYSTDDNGNVCWQTMDGDGYYRTVSLKGGLQRINIYTMFGIQIGFLIIKSIF